MANQFKKNDFRYYFAVSPGSVASYWKLLKGQDLLMSLASMVKKDTQETQLDERLKEIDGHVMLDSGAFSNFNKPNTVAYDTWKTFIKNNKGLFSEYVQFDDIRSRKKTISNYFKAINDGLRPLFVDHLHFNSRSIEVKDIWKESDKLCIAGFGKNSPGQENKFKKVSFLMDKFRKTIELAEAEDTMCHLLAIGSLRRFLPYMHRIHSVDSTSWTKAPASGEFCALKIEDLCGIKVPIICRFSFPGSINDKHNLNGKEKEKLWDDILSANRWTKGTPPHKARLVSIYWLKKYISEIKRFDPTDLKNAIEEERKEIVKMLDADEYGTTTVPYLDPIDPSSIDCGWTCLVNVEFELKIREYFPMPKPTRPAYPGQLQTVESFMALYQSHPDWLPAIVQKKHDGARVQIHRDGDKVIILTEDETDVTDRLPSVVSEVKKLKPSKLILDAEVETWDGSQHLPREVTSGYLNSQDEPDDSRIVVNVFDLLYDEIDIHEQPTHFRLEALEKIGIGQSTMGVPDTSVKLNLAPSETVGDMDELERVVRRVRTLPGSEGVVAKQVDAPYYIEESRTSHDTWVKFHNATTLNGLITSREPKKGGGWVYQYALDPDRLTVANVARFRGVDIAPVGNTFATAQDFAPGDVVVIEAETLNVEEHPEGLRVSAWVPRVIGPSRKTSPDTVEEAKERAKENLVLQEKKVDETGKVTYVPTRKIEKQADPFMEYPAEEKAYRYVVQHHHRGKSLHSDLRLELESGKLLVGWTLNTQIEGAIKEPVITLAQARDLADRHMDEVSKINWNTGEWATREKERAGEPVRVEILSERKAPEPFAWIDVEGKTRLPGPGEAPPVGGTRQYPGVFLIVDKGSVEYGAQKPWTHEYFFHGQALDYRMFFRQLRLSTEKAQHSHELCMECKANPPEVDVLWMKGQARAWFCQDCYQSWLESPLFAGLRMSSLVSGERAIKGGVAPASFGEVHKRQLIATNFDEHKDGSHVCIVLTVPEKIAEDYPDTDEVPHITILFLGDVPRQKLAGLVSSIARISSKRQPFQIGLAREVSYFEPTTNSRGKRVAKLAVESESLKELHYQLKTELQNEGIEIGHSFEYSPHSTLAYIEPDTEYEGPVPEGTWEAQELTLLGFEKPLSFALGSQEIKTDVLKMILPPSEPEAGLIGEPMWLAIYPDDQTPMVLAQDNVDREWMPPVGVSALPLAIRKQIPEQWHFWSARSAAKAKEIRDGLVAAISEGTVQLDFAAPYTKSISKASMLDADFVLQEQTWRGPIQIRTGPSKTLWWLRLDIGRPSLMSIRMYQSPLDNAEVTSEVETDRHKDAIEAEGQLSPGHYLNPTKDTPSWIKILDKGKAKVLSVSDSFIKVQFEGEKFKGLYTLTRNNGEWLWQPSQETPEVKVSKNTEQERTWVVPILKVDTEKRLVTGIVLEPDVVDAHGDYTKADAIERAAHKFLARYNEQTKLGLNHKLFGNIGVSLVESWVAPAPFKLGVQEVRKGSWLMTVHVDKDALWKQVKSGEFTGFSIGALATVASA